jgi:predicted  nucleic acid-binding Zn-ribbon protein
MYSRPILCSIFWGSMITCIPMLIAQDPQTEERESPAKKVTLVDGDDSVQTVADLDTEIAEIEHRLVQLRSEAHEMRKLAADEDRQWKSLLGEIERIETQQRELKDRRDEVERLAKKREEAKQALMKARKELEAAKKRVEEAEQAEEKTVAELKGNRERIDELQSDLDETEPKLEPLKRQASEAEEASQQVHGLIDDLEDRSSRLADQRVALAGEIEERLRAAGRWVSFREEIAPIFQGRCVSCHNASNPQGRYSMTNYSAVMAEGDSGLAVVPGDAEASLLYQYIDDGWMPYEADRLSDEEIEVIAHWIDRGARLDQSVDPEEPLIRIMPRQRQPDPPVHYHAPMPVTALAVDPTGERLASSGYHEALIWSTESGQLEQRLTNVAERVYGLAFHPDGRHLAVAAGNPGRLGEVKLFDLQEGHIAADLLVAGDAMFAVAFSPEGNRLAAAGADGSLSIVTFEDARPQEAQEPKTQPDDSENGEETKPLSWLADFSLRRIDDHSDWINSVAWSADGTRLVTASRDKTAKVFDADTLELLQTFSDHQENVTSALFLGDGKRVVSAGDDEKLRIWQAGNGKEQRKIDAVGGQSTKLQIVDKSHILSAGSDGQLQLHNADDVEKIQGFEADASWLSSLAVGADGQRIYVGNQSGRISTIGTDEWKKLDEWVAQPPAGPSAEELTRNSRSGS